MGSKSTARPSSESENDKAGTRAGGKPVRKILGTRANHLVLPWLSITCWVTLLRKPDIKQVTRVCLQVLPRSLWASWPIIQDALDSLAQPLGGILIGLMPHSAHRTAIHVSASGPALWGSQVRSHNKPTLHTIFHPYLLKGRQKTGKMLTSQHEALKSSSFSKEPSIY